MDNVICIVCYVICFINNDFPNRLDNGTQGLCYILYTLYLVNGYSMLDYQNLIMERTCDNCFWNGIYNVKGWCTFWNVEIAARYYEDCCGSWFPGKDFDIMERDSVHREQSDMEMLTAGRREVRCLTCDNVVEIPVDSEPSEERCDECGNPLDVSGEEVKELIK